MLRRLRRSEARGGTLTSLPSVKSATGARRRDLWFVQASNLTVFLVASFGVLLLSRPEAVAR